MLHCVNVRLAKPWQGRREIRAAPMRWASPLAARGPGFARSRAAELPPYCAGPATWLTMARSGREFATPGLDMTRRGREGAFTDATGRPSAPVQRSTTPNIRKGGGHTRGCPRLWRRGLPPDRSPGVPEGIAGCLAPTPCAWRHAAAMDLGRRAPRRVHVAVRSLRAPSRSASVLPAWPSFGSAVHGHPSGTPFWFELSSMSVRLTPRFPPERVRGTHTTATMLPDSVAATNPGLGVSPAARGPGFARSRAANNAAQLRRASTATNRRGGAVPALRARIPDAVRHRPHAFGTAGRSLGSRSTPQPAMRFLSSSGDSAIGGFCGV